MERETLIEIATIIVDRVMKQCYSPLKILFKNDLYSWGFTISNSSEDRARMITYTYNLINFVRFEAAGITLAFTRPMAISLPPPIVDLDTMVSDLIEDKLKTFHQKLMTIPNPSLSNPFSSFHQVSAYSLIQTPVDEWLRSMSTLHIDIFKLLRSKI